MRFADDLGLGRVRVDRIGVVTVGQVSANPAARAVMAAVGAGVGDTTAALLTVAPRQAA